MKFSSHPVTVHRDESSISRLSFGRLFIPYSAQNARAIKKQPHTYRVG